MGDSAWAVGTNVTFDRINAMIVDTSNQLTVSEANSITWGSAFVRLLGKRLDTGLRAHYERLSMVKTRSNALQDAALAHHSERSKRATFSGIGWGMKWIFGVATTDQFTKLDGKIKKMIKELASWTHLFRHQVTLIN